MSLVGRVGVGLLLAGVVAAASTSRLGGGGSVSSSTVYVLATGAGLLVVAGLISAAWVTGHAAFAGSTMRGRALVMIGIGAATLTTLAVLVLLPRLVSEKPVIPAYGHGVCMDAQFFWQHYPDRRDELFQHPGRFCWSDGIAEKMSSHGGAPTEISGSLVALVAGGALGVLIVGGALLAVAVRHSRRRDSSEVVEQDPDVLVALDQSLDDLRRERDVRRAIVACYARMERALASAGRERRAHETPFEFLRRVLERVAYEPGQVLTELFERARFSLEPMGEKEKRSAIAALEQLRARMAG